MNQTKLLNGPDDLILIDNTLYIKSLQPIWPIMVTVKMPLEDNLESFRPTKNCLFKGHNRWTHLPERAESNLQSINDDNNSERQSRLESRKRVRDHSSVNLIVDQWRKKWQLSQKYNDSTVEALLRDMTDAHPTIRMQAIVTIAKSGSRALRNADDVNDGPLKETMRSDVIPDVLLQSIQILLDDTHQQVRKAAAVALHSLETCSDKSLKILRDMLGSGSSVDRWTAAQCLALSDIYDSHVISELVDQLMNSEDIIIHEKSSILLAKMSFHTKLVHGMLGEKLNTVSWRQRIIICKTLPLLHGSLNKDIMRKLIYLMWNDQHREVRIASSHAIGKTGNGKAVHDELIKKLQDVSEIVRTDALEKIGILKVMTTRMMPSFLKCFNDDFVIVRKEVCRTCYRLAINDELCVKNMLDIARYDPSYRVKIYAVRALSKVKVVNPNIRTCFTWALQYESEVRLRCEALHSLLMSIEMDKEMVDILKSRFLVEDDRDVVKLLKKALISIGINPDEDIDTVAEVKSEVRRFLSDKNHITDIILDNESVEDYDLQRELMIASSLEVSPESSEREENPKETRVQFADLEAYQEDQGDEVIVQYGTTNIREKTFYDLMEEHNVMLERVDEDEEFSQEDVQDNEEEDGDKEEEEVKEDDEVKEELKEEEELKYEKEEEDRVVILNQVNNCEINEDEMGSDYQKEGVGEEKDEKEKLEKEIQRDEEDKDNIEESTIIDQIVEDIQLDSYVDNVMIVDLKPDTERSTDDFNNKNEEIKKESVDVTKEPDRANDDERVIDAGEADELLRCTYNLPSDTSYLKVFSSEKSLTWMTWETPMMYDDPSQLNMLESTISSSIIEQVNSAIEYEGIDCGPSEQM